jgi:hypothetical protein
MLCEYVPTELAKEILQLTLAIELRSEAYRRRQRDGFYGSHIFAFGILRFTPTYIDALSDLGVAILCSIMFMLHERRYIKSVFQAFRAELLLMIASFPKRVKNILLLGTLLKKAMVYDKVRFRFLQHEHYTMTLRNVLSMIYA